MKKIYIAGAITGVKRAKAIFDKARQELEKLGYKLSALSIMGWKNPAHGNNT